MRYSLEIEVDQPHARVAELFGNPDNLGAWQPGFAGIEHRGGEPGQRGATYALKYLHGKREMELLETVEVDNLPGEYTATYEAPGIKMRVRNVFEEAGPGRTTWRSENDAEVSGFLMRAITLIMPGCFRKQSRKYMEHFKAFAEDGADLREKG